MKKDFQRGEHTESLKNLMIAHTGTSRAAVLTMRAIAVWQRFTPFRYDNFNIFSPDCQYLPHRFVALHKLDFQNSSKCTILP